MTNDGGMRTANGRVRTARMFAGPAAVALLFVLLAAGAPKFLFRHSPWSERSRLARATKAALPAVERAVAASALRARTADQVGVGVYGADVLGRAPGSAPSGQGTTALDVAVYGHVPHGALWDTGEPVLAVLCARMVVAEGVDQVFTTTRIDCPSYLAGSQPGLTVLGPRD